MNPPPPSVPEPLIPDGGVVLTSIALNSYTAAPAFKAIVAPASETCSSGYFYRVFFSFSM